MFFQITYIFVLFLFTVPLMAGVPSAKDKTPDTSSVWLKTVRSSPVGNFRSMPGNKEEADSLKMQKSHINKDIQQNSISLNSILPPHELKLGLTGIYQGVPEGNSRKSISAVSGSIDLEMAFHPLKSSKTFVHLESGKGAGIDAKAASFSGFNFDADDNTSLRITELWYEQEWFEGSLRTQFGKIDLSASFDMNSAANSETEQFLSPSFRNNSALEFPDQNSIGTRFCYSFNKLLEIGFGIAEADADWNRVFDDMFSIIEVNLKSQLNGWQGNYRIYFWKNDKDHTSLLSSGPENKSNYGAGLSADQEVTEGLLLFSRIGLQRGDLSRLHYAFSAGFQLTGDTAGFGENVLGAAFGINLTGKYAKASDSMNFITTANELHLEAYYRIKVNNFFHFSPDIQWTGNPDGNADKGSIWAFGIRTQISI